MCNILKCRNGLFYNLNNIDYIFFSIGGTKGKADPILKFIEIGKYFFLSLFFLKNSLRWG